MATRLGKVARQMMAVDFDEEEAIRLVIHVTEDLSKGITTQGG
jgi:hypothetical protein